MESRIGNWMKKNKEFELKAMKEGHKALYNLHITSSAVSKAIGDFLESFDLTAQQFNLLRILRGSGKEALCLKDVKERLVDRNSDVPRLVKRMELKGLIKRECDSCDKRQSNLTLDEKGIALLAKIDAKDNTFPYSLMSGISDSDFEKWNELTIKILNSIEIKNTN